MQTLRNARLWLFLLLTFLGTSMARKLQGDSWCSYLMCITAIVNGTSVTYRMTALAQMGWMAIGFGTVMQDSSMVIMWPNSDGTVVMSQRTADGLVEPKPDRSPPRTASIFMPLTAVTSPSLAFTVPKNSDTNQSAIWALGVTSPNTANPDAFLIQHEDSGAFHLNLLGELDDSVTTSGPTATGLPPSASSTTSSSTTTSATPTSSSDPEHGPDDGKPLTKYDKLIIGHAILSVIGFLFILPLGALVARWGRTFTTRWFNYHWISQVVFSIPVVIVGWALGPLAVAGQGKGHVNDAHKILGFLLLPLYLLQLCLGSFIHFVKPQNGRLHPPPNFVHAAFGIVIIGLAFFQVRTGFSVEWTQVTKHGIDLDLVSNIWIAWVIFLPLLYFFGFVLLKRQLKSERTTVFTGIDSPPPYSVQEPTPASSTGIRSLLDRSTADDGTHDMYSDTATASSPSSQPIEMREVERPLPVLLAASR
ncbi:hypothetical protein BD410DRAFT_714470 [Rickenella mellea]|uniref:Cytochrome b561 domain-containing protein n=1 Tax=Rickenella mellea TaxID=50990 RepID=A0A4Y7QJN3_9AGAM|nr:hypothetical protein BD410DRAFT_714470 [Rickenella mellea]